MGGHAAFNPEPLAPFIDAAVLGDEEQAVGRISDLIAQWQADGRPGDGPASSSGSARTGSVYVPAFYDVTYRGDGAIAAITPIGLESLAGQQTHADGS